MLASLRSKRCNMGTVRYFLVILTLTTTLSRGTEAACRFGASAREDCAFQCNCNHGNSICDPNTGCQGQCADSPPTGQGFRWGGEACQIGNVAYRRPAVQTGTYGGLTADRAVDGILDSDDIGNQYCAHPYTNTGPAMWTVDLGSSHRLYHVTIYNREDYGGNFRLSNFKLSISDDNVTYTDCASYPNDTYPDPSVTLPCETTGRYVRFQKVGTSSIRHYDDIGVVTLCEVVIIGHKLIDCVAQQCADTCSPVTGCDQCQPGWQLPGCTEQCPSGTHGDGCMPCSENCKDNTCNPVTGHCTEGCRQWYAGDRCDIQIARTHYSDSDNVRLTVTSVTSSSVELQWGQQPDLPQGISDLGEYYGYLLTYRPNDTSQQTQYGSYSHNRERDSLTTDVNGLDYYRTYVFEVVPYRVWEGVRENGVRYPQATATTLCRAPTVTLGPVTTATQLLLVTWTVRDIGPGCTSLSSVVIEYRLSGSTTWTQYPVSTSDTQATVQLQTGGTYDVRVTVTNKVGVSDTTQSRPVDVEGPTPALTPPVPGTRVIPGSTSVPTTQLITTQSRSLDATESHVPWILFGIALAVILGLIIFTLVICRRHGSARRHLCPATQSKDSKPSESVPSPRPDVQTEPEYERTDIIQYESLRDKPVVYENPGTPYETIRVNVQ